MAKLATVKFTGKSGTPYEFNVYPFNTIFKDVPAVYFVTKRYQNDKGGYSHDEIYVGETHDLSDRFDNHHKADCFAYHDANAICVHQEGNHKKRLEIESDLRDKYNPPCND